MLMRDHNIEDITCENVNVPVGVMHRKYPEFFIMDTNIKFMARARTRWTCSQSHSCR